MKNLIYILTLCLITTFITTTAIAAQTKYKLRPLQGNAVNKISVTNIDARGQTITVGDRSYKYNDKLRVHTSVTNFGTIRSLRIGNKVRFSLSNDKKGELFISEIWVLDR